MERRAATVMFERRMSDTWTIAAGAGAALPGLLEIGRERYAITSGWLVSGAMSWRLLEARGNLPFLLFSATLGLSGASTRLVTPVEDPAPEASLYAFDIRAGLLVGKTFWDALSPYAALRLFGGPIFWERRGESTVGTDLRHFQLAVGMSSALPLGVDLFAEIAPLGERAVTVGAGVAF